MYLDNGDLPTSPDALLCLLSYSEDEDELEKMLLTGKGAAIRKAALADDFESVKYLLEVSRRLGIDECMLSYDCYGTLLKVAERNLPDMHRHRVA